MRRRLIVVSNRGPVTYAREDGRRVARRGAGGLVTALRGLLQRHDVTWVASAMTAEDRAVAEEAAGAELDERARDGSPYRLRLVTHDPAAYDRFYNVVANPLLWFVQHRLWELGRAPSWGPELHEAWAAGYAAVNERFAETVVEELDRQPGAAVFFHDYHLYLAPALVRAARPDATMAHFVHIPWPDAGAWSALPGPERRAVHEGLLANDVVAFHTARWARAFEGSCAEVLGAPAGEGRVEHGGRTVTVAAHPVSVDPAEFEELARSEAVQAEERALAERRPERLVLRVDRTDPSKNVVRGFEAFGLYLERHSEAHGRVGMLALLDPSRQEIAEYAAYLHAVHAAARAVNERFARPGWTPVDLRVADNFPQSVAAYRQFDVLLVNAVFDGLNLVAKEAPLVNARDGVVVLSENAGAFEELAEWALPVSPFDVAGQAEAIHRALELPAAERRRRAEGIRAHVRAHDVAAWLAALLADLDRAQELHRS